MKERLEVTIGEKAAQGEVTGRPFWRERAVIGHFRHMVAAHRHIKPQFTVGAHQGELIRIALIVEKLGEIFLRPFHITYMDERDALAEVTCNAFESVELEC